MKVINKDKTTDDKAFMGPNDPANETAQNDPLQSTYETQPRVMMNAITLTEPNLYNFTQVRLIN